MRYRVILPSGKTLCNVPEKDRSVSISDAYPGSYVIDSTGRTVHTSKGGKQS